MICPHPLLDLTQNYYALFGLAPHFEIDVDVLSRHYRDIQSSIHPDRFVGSGDQEQRVAVQTAAFVNEAYHCLKNPLLRAEYLLRLKGHDLNSEARSHHDTAFLLEQMGLREQLEAIPRQANPSLSLELWKADVARKVRHVQETFARALEAGDEECAVDNVLKWKFLVKLRSDADRLQDHLEQD